MQMFLDKSGTEHLSCSKLEESFVKKWPKSGKKMRNLWWTERYYNLKTGIFSGLLMYGNWNHVFAMGVGVQLGRSGIYVTRRAGSIIRWTAACIFGLVTLGFFFIERYVSWGQNENSHQTSSQKRKFSQ